MPNRNPQSEFLSPQDLAVCQRVFNQVCTDDNLDHDCIDGQILASTVLRLFQQGFVDEAALLFEIRAHRDDFMKLTG